MAKKSTETTPSERRRGSMLDVAIVAIAACIAGLANDYANDDIELIARNARVHELSQWRDWFTLPYWPPPFSPDLYRPVTTTLHALEYVIGGGGPMLYRVVSYLLYALVCIGVLSLASRFVSRRVALGAAFVFAAHPVHVEATALGVGQAELLTALLSITMLVRYVDARRRGVLSSRDWTVLAVLYLLAALTKEQGLVIPGLLLSAEFLLIQPATPRRWRDFTGSVALGASAFAALAVRRAVLGDFAGTFKAEALDGVDVTGRVLTFFATVPRWTRLLLWPAHLSVDYSPQDIMASATLGAQEVLGLVILVTVLTTAWRFRRRVPLYGFGVAWCAITLFPVSNVLVVTGVVLAERTLFSPSVGVVLALAALAEHVLVSRPASRRTERVLAGAVGMLVLLGLARSVERQRVWRNDGFLVARSIKDAPRSFRNQRAFGDLMFELDQPKLGHEAFALAVRYAPPSSVWRVRNNYARALSRRGELAGAAEQFRQSLAQRPDQDFERAELAVTYLTMGDYARAAAQADTGALRGGRPDIYRALRGIADSAARAGAPAGSVRIGLGRGNVRADR